MPLHPRLATRDGSRDASRATLKRVRTREQESDLGCCWTVSRPRLLRDRHGGSASADTRWVYVAQDTPAKRADEWRSGSREIHRAALYRRDDFIIARREASGIRSDLACHIGMRDTLAVTLRFAVIDQMNLQLFVFGRTDT